MTGPSFRFRLERVRVIRERKEKLAQRELAVAISRHSSTVAELRSADAEVAHARDEQRVAAARSGSVSAAELLAHQAFLERTEAQRHQYASELEQREAEVAKRDAALATAASEHKMLERLSERRRGEHDRELARRELGALDEIAAIRFHRSRA
ncbi:MAG TPA: flagellar export protein FliJ [Solirubrobacteraceae bacterium]|nr:flagellar export protein FliJ [Solirubrobacteraceae bacterium]